MQISQITDSVLATRLMLFGAPFNHLNNRGQSASEVAAHYNRKDVAAAMRAWHNQHNFPVYKNVGWSVRIRQGEMDIPLPERLWFVGLMIKDGLFFEEVDHTSGAPTDSGRPSWKRSHLIMVDLHGVSAAKVRRGCQSRH